MKKIVLSIVLSVLLVSGELLILLQTYKKNNSIFMFLLFLVFIQLSTPIIVSLIASVKQEKYNKMFSASLATLIASIVTLIPFYLFTVSSAVNQVIERMSDGMTSQNGSHIVELELNLGFSSFLGQIIIWVLIGTIVGWIVQVISKRNKSKGVKRVASGI